MTVISGLDVEIDNSRESSDTKISAIITKDIGVRNIWNKLKLPDQSDRLHEVAKRITFWKKKAESWALDSYSTAEASRKLIAAKIN